MNTNSNSTSSRRGLIIFLSILVPALFFLAWSQASLNLSFIRPSNAGELSALLALSAFIFIAFVIFALILARILLKLYVERKQQQLGARFKTRMVVAFLALSLLPVCFLFFFAYGLLNHSIERWFGTPFDVVRKDATEIVRQLERQEEQQSLHDAEHLSTTPELVGALSRNDWTGARLAFGREASELGLDSALLFQSNGHLLGRTGRSTLRAADMLSLLPALHTRNTPLTAVAVPLHLDGANLMLAARPVVGAGGERLGTVVSVRQQAVNI